AAFRGSRVFFEQPEALKERVFHKQSKSLAGWEPLCAQSLDQVSAPDLKESYYCSFDLPDDHPYVAAGMRSWGANQWPADLPGFRAAMLDYLSAVTALSLEMVSLFATSLDLSARHFDPMFEQSSCHLRLVRYPPHPADAPLDQYGAGTHTDWGAITLLAQDDAGGLQVRNVDDRWIDAEPMPGAFIVNIGDLMARWTNDYYRSSFHRVRNNRAGRDRYSMAFFHAPDPQARIACLPTCASADNPPRYETCTAIEHMMQMVERTYGKGQVAA
ncbi:MAG: 2OG-Fe(II) oxygenase family protein, partial [Burkholderiales bacterium]